MSKRIVILICIGIFVALCWTATGFVCAFLTGYQTFELVDRIIDQTVLVEGIDPAGNPEVCILDANNSFFKVIKAEPNRIEVKWTATTTNMPQEKCRVKQFDSALVRVMGKLNGADYPIVIDSGCNQCLIVNGLVVAESRLPVFPLGEGMPTSGFCHVDKLEIGEMVIKNPACCYDLTHYERRVFGKTKWQDKDILLGLKLIESFSYILIDKPAKEVEFGGKASFEDDGEQSWERYPMSVENDRQKVSRLMVTIPLAGQDRKLMLDTGADCGLLVSPRIWSEISSGLKIVSQHRDRVRMRNGWKKTKKMIVEKLDIGGRTITDAAVNVMDDDSVSDEYFLLGMGYFRKSVIVLDFRHGRMLIKNP